VVLRARRPTAKVWSIRYARMMDSILEQSGARRRHRVAPLLKEREQFLSHLLRQGTSQHRVRSVAAYLIHIIRFMVAARDTRSRMETKFCLCPRSQEESSTHGRKSYFQTTPRSLFQEVPICAAPPQSAAGYLAHSPTRRTPLSPFGFLDPDRAVNRGPNQTEP
jgi:hypothetical protein